MFNERYLLELIDTTIHTIERQARRLEQQEREDRETLRLILRELRKISAELSPPLPPPPHPITSFVITQQGDPTMPLLPIAPGFSPVFTATPVPAGSVPNLATPPTWTSSDTTNASISVDSTGLVCTVAIPATAVVGTSVTLSISYTNADGTVATGSISITIVAAPSPDITSFSIVQTQ